MRDRDRDDFDRRYGNGSGPEGYGGRDYAHTSSFGGSENDFSEPSGRHRSSGPDYGSGNRGRVSNERDRFDDRPPAFGANLQGNFGFDRGGEGSYGSGYFSGSDRGRPTTSGYASGHGGNAYRSGMAHDRFEDVPSEMRSPEQTMRSYRGVGPKSYRRGDDQLRELVCERLSDDHHVDASDIEVTVENGVVRLAGSVPDRRTKRLAEDIAESVRGIQDVENHLRIGTT